MSLVELNWFETPIHLSTLHALETDGVDALDAIVELVDVGLAVGLDLFKLKSFSDRCGAVIMVISTFAVAAAHLIVDRRMKTAGDVDAVF